MEKKQFDTLIIATAITHVGLVACKYSDMMDVAVFVLGYDIFSHELGNEKIVDRMSDLLREQFPEMPTRDEALDDHEKAADKALHAYGDMVWVTKGSDERTSNPLANLAELMGPDQKIVVVVTE